MQRGEAGLHMKSLLVRSVGPAAGALREGGARVTGLVLLIGAAVGLLSAMQALGHTQPAAEAFGAASELVQWTNAASPPTQTQAAAIGDLLDLLTAIAWVTTILALVTVLVRSRMEAARRGREIGIRRAVGASRTDILAALLVEGGVTASLAVAVGATIAVLLLGLASRFWPGTMPAQPVLTAGLFIIPATVLLACLSPLRFLRNQHLRSFEPGVVPLALPRLQLAVSLAILMGSGALLGGARRSDPALVPQAARGGLVIQIDSGIAGTAERAEAYGRLMDRLRLLMPGAVMSLTAPGGLVGLGTSDNVTTDCGLCVRGGIFIPYQHTRAVHLFVSPDSFVAGGARIVAGRGLTHGDRMGETRVAVVNRHLALRYFHRGDAVGRKVWLGSDLRREPYEVVGIVEDVPSAVLGGALQPRPAVYLSVLQLPPAAADLLIRADTPFDPARVEAAIDDTIGSARVTGRIPEARYAEIQSRPTAWFATWFAFAGGVVLLTATAGTFSAVRLWVGSLATELSLRRTVGASRARIAGFVLIRALGIAGGGTVLGLFLYFVIVRDALTTVVRDLPAWNAELFVVLAALLGLIAVLAAGIPTAALLRHPPIQEMR